MKELWGFLAPVSSGGSNSSRLPPSRGVLPARAPRGAETPGRNSGGGGEGCQEPQGTRERGAARARGNPRWVRGLAALGGGPPTRPAAHQHPPTPLSRAAPPKKASESPGEFFPPPPIPSFVFSSLP